MQILLGLIVLILLIACAIFAYSLYKVHLSLTLRHPINSDTPETYKLPYQTLTFKTADGTHLSGWYVPAPNSKAVVIVVHGYLEVKGSVAKHASYLHKAGYTTFFIDLKSDLPKQKTTLGVEEYKDVIAAYDYMHAFPENKNKKIGFLGISMGAASTIIAVSKSGKGDFILAIVPYANFTSLMKAQIKFENLPEQILPFVTLANTIVLGSDYALLAPDKLVQKINKPIIFISAGKDVYVNPDDAKKLFTLANEPKYYWRSPNATHDIYKDDQKEYQKHIVNFLNTIH